MKMKVKNRYSFSIYLKINYKNIKKKIPLKNISKNAIIYYIKTWFL